MGDANLICPSQFQVWLWLAHIDVNLTNFQLTKPRGPILGASEDVAGTSPPTALQ